MEGLQPVPVEVPEESFWTEEKLDVLLQQLGEQHYAVVEGFLSEKEVQEILEVFQVHEENDAFKAAGIGASDELQVNKAIRRDYIKWIEPATAYPPTKRYLKKIDELVQYLNRYCYLGIKDSEFHFAVYPPGGFYKRHLDQFRNNDHRRISCVCYMNQNWQPEHGGLLRMYLPQPDGSEVVKDITPTAGKLVIFRSDLIEHEVTTASQDRYSITGWLLDKPLELTFL